MKTARQLVEEARALVHTITPAALRARLGEHGLQILDIREDDEVVVHGSIPGALHVPRGLLEFRIDPRSPWAGPEAAPASCRVLVCDVGWRSALAARALQEMGVPGVCHLEGGFRAWEDAGCPVHGAAALG